MGGILSVRQVLGRVLHRKIQSRCADHIVMAASICFMSMFAIQAVIADCSGNAASRNSTKPYFFSQKGRLVAAGAACVILLQLAIVNRTGMPASRLR